MSKNKVTRKEVMVNVTPHPSIPLTAIVMTLAVVAVLNGYSPRMEGPPAAPNSPTPAPVAPHRQPEIAWNFDIGPAVKQAQEKNFPILLYFESDGCHWCQKMNSETFESQDVKTYVSGHFVAVKLSNAGLVASQYGITGYPGFVVMDSSHSVSQKFTGFLSPAQFIKKLGS